MIGLPLPILLGATVVGLVVGTAYTLSPTTVLFLIWVPALFGWAKQDLGPRERRWVLGLLGVAVVVRVVAVAVFFLLADHFAEPYAVMAGDERHLTMSSHWTLNLALGRVLAPPDYVGVFSPYGRSGFITALAYWQLWFGASPYGAHLINIAMWLTGAVALHRTARRAFGPLAALGGFSALLFMPTFLFWSISALKEPAYFFLTAVTIAAAMAVVRKRKLTERIAAAGLVVLAIAAIAPLRSIGLFVTAGGLAIAAGGWLVTRRAWSCMAVGVLIIVGGLWGLRLPVVQDRLMAEMRYAGVVHLGHVRTTGHSYKLLDQEVYDAVWEGDPVADMQPVEAARFAGRAAASFFVVPLPWNVVSKSALALMPQQVAWYLLAPLALVGVIAGLRRDDVFTWVLVGNILPGIATVAFFNGNVGTLVRLRDIVVTQVVWLSALGGCVALEWAAGSFSRGSQHGHSR